MSRRPQRLRARYNPLSISQILAWADLEHEQTGRWPCCKDTIVWANKNEKWINIDALLRIGGRSLPGGDSLPQLLAREREVRNRSDLPDLSVAEVKRWARQHFSRTGKWPHYGSGDIPGSAQENWHGVERALREGIRSFPGGDSLARFLARHFRVRNKASTPRLTLKQILNWADAHHKRTTEWPTVHSGTILEAPSETWQRIDTALREGLRGLKDSSSLAQLLAAKRGVRNKAKAPPLSLRLILQWADAHHQRTSRWPGQASGPVLDAPGENWCNIQTALYHGGRGLPGGDSLFKLLARNRKVKRPGHQAPSE